MEKRELKRHINIIVFVIVNHSKCHISVISSNFKECNSFIIAPVIYEQIVEKCKLNYNKSV